MKVQTVLTLAAVASCSSSSTLSPLDASVDSTTTVPSANLTLIGSNIAGISVFSSTLSGKLIEATRTDSNGFAELQIVEGGMISFSYHPYLVFSLAGVSDGDALSWRYSDSSTDQPVDTFEVRLPEFDSSATIFACDAELITFGDSALESMTLTQTCDDAEEFEVISFARNDGVWQFSKGSASTPAVLFNPLEMPQWSSDWDRLPVSPIETDESHLTTASVVLEGATGSVRVPSFPVGDDATVRVPPGEYSPRWFSLHHYGSGGRREYFGPLPFPQTDQLLPEVEIFEVEFADERLSAHWSPVAGGDLISLSFFLGYPGRPLNWLVVGPPDLESVVFPDVPEGSGIAPADTEPDDVYASVDAIDFDSVDSYAMLHERQMIRAWDFLFPSIYDRELEAGESRQLSGRDVRFEDN